MRILCWLMVLLVACVPARRRAQGDVVRNIHFDGNAGLFSGQNDLQLRNQMEQESSRFGMMVFPLMYFTDPAVYVPEDLARDAYRLEVWYAHRGYLDAKVLGFATRRLRARGEKRAGIVDILGYVEPGEPSLVRAYDIVGTTPATGVWANLVKRTGLQRPGRQFDMLSAERDRALLELNLKDHGYAYADVTLALNAYPDEKAIDLELKMDPGQFTHIGEIEITGNKAVKEKFIRQNLRLTPGQPYRLDDLTAAQNRLFGMGTFSLVTVKPDLSDPTQTEVPIEVRVTENRFRTIRFGVGLRTHGVQNWEPAVQVRFKHSHLLYQLIKFEAGARVGLSGYSPSPKIESKVFPIWRLDGAISYPRIFGQRVTQQLQAQLERRLDQNIARVDNPEFDLRTIWRPTDALVLRMGPHLEFFEYVDLDQNLLEEAQRVYGPEFQGTYRLTTVDLGLTLDWRDDPLTSRRGSFLSGTLRYAFPLLSPDDYHFLALSGDWRLFRPIRFKTEVPLTLATRVHGKILIPIGDDGIPYPEKVFFGGASSMRGFPSRSMGPYQALVSTLDGADRVRFLPEGGTVGLALVEELRYHTTVGLSYALFGEIATLSTPWGAPSNQDPDPLGQGILDGTRVTGGIGVRYGSPLGPIRIDLAVRPLYEEDRCPANFNMCDAGSRLQRRLDVVRTFDADSKLPAFMFFFAFGEAI